MKKIFLFLIQLIILAPRFGHALKTVTDYQDDVGGFSAFEFDSPILMFLNISAFVILVISIIWFIKGYTIKDLASGNIKEIQKGNKLMARGMTGFAYAFIVFAIDLGVY